MCKTDINTTIINQIGKIRSNQTQKTIDRTLASVGK